MICIINCAIEKECRMYSLTGSITLPLLIFSIIYLYSFWKFNSHYNVMEEMLYWTVILENKNFTRENYRHQRTVNLTNTAQTSS